MLKCVVHEAHTLLWAKHEAHVHIEMMHDISSFTNIQPRNLTIGHVFLRDDWKAIDLSFFHCIIEKKKLNRKTLGGERMKGNGEWSLGAHYGPIALRSA